jgi:hypothetical protein
VKDLSSGRALNPHLGSMKKTKKVTGNRSLFATCDEASGIVAKIA